MTESVQRLPAEGQYAEELAALAAADDIEPPPGWRLSPRAVRRFILGSGGETVGGRTIERKIRGNDAVVERAIVTLIGQRGLLLVGEPGTAKSMLSELLAAAISGDSTQTVQGGAGVIEESIRYSWNYALLLKDGPTRQALVPGPLHTSMQAGQLMRFEEITRCPTEVQDNLIPVLSDRVMHIPELDEAEGETVIRSRPGFNIIATANLNDRGVNEMSSALKRRFNFETMQPLTSRREQLSLIHDEVNRELAAASLPVTLSEDVADVLVTAFEELRAGSVDGTAVESPSTVLSTAEAISIAHSAAVDCHYFGEQQVTPGHLSRYFVGTVIKDSADDTKRFRDYVTLVERKRGHDARWQSFIAGYRGSGHS